jgi:hypothetical protein
MENDEFELAKELFNRLKNYLIDNNAVQKIALRANNIWIYSPHLLKWYCWPYAILNKKELLKSFLIGANNFYTSYFDEYKYSFDPVVKNLCKCIGKHSCLEELAIKMDLMGI